MARSFLIGLSVIATLVTIVSGNVIPNNSIPGRIVGGHDAEPHSAPWIISLQFSKIHQCGGSVLNNEWILTAGHCLIGFPNNAILEVVAGRHNLAAIEWTEERRIVDKRIIHPNYPGGVAPFDIALAHVDVPFAFTSSIRPIALPARDALHSGFVRLYGWGSISTDFRPTYPNILQTVIKPLVDYNKCESILGSLLHPTNLCTGPLNGGISACSADSGGPLDQDGVLVGIVSWGSIPCGQPDSPSVYVRVSAFIDWIEGNLP